MRLRAASMPAHDVPHSIRRPHRARGRAASLPPPRVPGRRPGAHRLVRRRQRPAMGRDRAVEHECMDSRDGASREIRGRLPPGPLSRAGDTQCTPRTQATSHPGQWPETTGDPAVVPACPAVHGGTGYVSRAFPAALASVPAPGWLGRDGSPWTVSDQLAWGERDCADGPQVDQLLARRWYTGLPVRSSSAAAGPGWTGSAGRPRPAGYIDDARQSSAN